MSRTLPNQPPPLALLSSKLNPIERVLFRLAAIAVAR
jgi:hypothetical protein